MSNSPDTAVFAPLAEDTPRDAFAGGDAPVVFLRHAPASNDPVAAERADSNDVDSIPRPSPAAGGRASTLGAWELYHAARAHRAYALAEITATLAKGAAEICRRAWDGRVQRRRANTIRDALAGLDDHTLRDLGLHRSEIGSLAAEATGHTERTRMLARLPACGFTP